MVNFKKGFKKLGLAIGIAAFLNYPLPFFVYPFFVRNPRDSKIVEVCKTQSYVDLIRSIERDPKPGALRFLKYAHAISSRYLEHSEKKIFINKKKRAFDERKADCACYTSFTYNNYLYLCNQLGVKELKDRVRLCFGKVKFLYDFGPHLWLEFNEDGEWKSYETFMDCIIEGSYLDELDFINIDSTIPSDIVLKEKYETYQITASFQEKSNDKNKIRIYPSNIFKTRGLVMLSEALY